MNQAVKQAKLASRAVTPNPRVGAIIVKNGIVVGKGYHQQSGKPHAEVNAISSAKNSTDGSTIYITLEPCCTSGKTPPCTTAIIKSGIKKVVLGILDPNPNHCGKGIEILRQNGIEVVTGIEQDKCDLLIEDFRKYVTEKIPFVISKVGITLDGKIATSTGESKWITSSASRNKVQQIRSNVDAILIGTNTALNDNPRLTVRTTSKKNVQPWRILLDPKLAVAENSILLNDELTSKTVIFTSIQTSGKKKFELLSKKVRIIPIETENDFFPPKLLLREIAKLPVVSLLIEGGGTTLGHFLDHKLIDKMYFFIAPKIIGDKQAISSFQGKGTKNISDVLALKNIKWRKFGQDMMLEGYPDWRK